MFSWYYFLRKVKNKSKFKKQRSKFKGKVLVKADVLLQTRSVKNETINCDLAGNHQLRI